jgi:Ca2+-binding RTX toxin-like protein
LDPLIGSEGASTNARASSIAMTVSNAGPWERLTDTEGGESASGDGGARAKAIVAPFSVDLTDSQAFAVADAAGPQAGVSIRGGDGDDLLIGSSGDDTLSGGAGDDTLIGGEGSDLLDGGKGADVMVGGRGDDHYIVDDARDVVVEFEDEGVDTVTLDSGSLQAFDLAATPHVENLDVIGNAGVVVGGNALQNTLTGASGNDTLSGGDGKDVLLGENGNDRLDGGTDADVMAGGAGNDTYVVDNAGDQVVENADEGVDIVIVDTASVQAFSLADTPNVENLQVSGDADFTGTGNELDNVVMSGGGNDSLDGGDGADVMAGGAGNDTYVVDNAGDQVVENADQGIDTVIVDTASLPAYSLSASPYVENLHASGDADFTGSGNDLDNVISGAGGDDTLFGAVGSDLLIGQDGNDVLDGGQGADIMAGGAGNDTYVIDDQADIVVEFSGQGLDTVETSLGSCVLDENFENLTYTGAGDFVGTGNDGSNVLIGGDGADLLCGDQWSPPLPSSPEPPPFELGPAGDTLDFNNAFAGGGSDQPAAMVGSVFAGSRRNDTYTDQIGGDDTIIGGRGNDTIDGGFGDDVISGDDGNDFIAGGMGNDFLTGGEDNDVFIFGRGFGIDTIADFQIDGSDQDEIQLFSGAFESFEDLEANIHQVGNDVVIFVSPTDQIILLGIDKMRLSVPDHFTFG